MRERRCAVIYRLTLVMSAGVLLGEGCIGPTDLQRAFLESFNSLVYRAIELGLTNLFCLPPAA